ncbi:MAG: chemotaxis protein CheD [Planctomycetota bacterium]
MTNVPMGEISFARQKGVLKTLLGSCVGIAFYHGPSKTASLAHVLLPASNVPTGIIRDRREDSFPAGRYVDTAIDAMLNRLEQESIAATSLQASIGGCADMFGLESTDSVGTLNREAVARELSKHRIPILVEHCGGNQAVRMSLNVATGKTTFQRVSQRSLRTENQRSPASTPRRQAR